MDEDLTYFLFFEECQRERTNFIKFVDRFSQIIRKYNKMRRERSRRFVKKKSKYVMNKKM